VTQELPEYALGTIAAARAKAVERHLRTCTACARQRDTYFRTLGGLARVLPPVSAPRAVLDKLVAGLSGGARFAHFVEPVASLFDISADAAKRYLELLMTPSAWQEGPAPGIGLVPVDPGPKYPGAFAGFVRIPAGVHYPQHVHLGVEYNLVLQGGFHEQGRDVWRGESIRKGRGTSHDQVGLPGVECIVATLLRGEIRLV
jgi:putative transcriptional regulator